MNTIISMTSKTKINIILFALVGVMFTGCATILHGTHQEMKVRSIPAGANVYIQGAQVGVTPATLHLQRKHNYELVFKKDGYKPVKVRIRKNFKVLPAVLGNIFWIPIIGIVVDIVDGAAYKLSPEQITTHLKKLKNAGYLPGITKTSKNEITVVMLTKKEWKSMK